MAWWGSFSSSSEEVKPKGPKAKVSYNYDQWTHHNVIKDEWLQAGNPNQNVIFHIYNSQNPLHDLFDEEIMSRQVY